VRPAFLHLACISLALGPAARAAEASGLSGEWDGPLGRMRIERAGEGLRGTLVAPSERCPFRAGEEVLRGTVVDDSLAGQLRVCLSGKGCPPEEWGNALFLVGPRRLSGAVHVKDKACRTPLGKKGGLALTRAESTPTSTGTRTSTPAEPATPTGKPTPDARRRAKAVMRDGAAWLREGGFEQARERFLEALEIDASIPEAYNGVGVTYRMRNDLPRALEWYKKALAVDPDFGDAYYNMACVYALQGERTLALRYLQIAAMNGYVTAEGVDGDSDLASLRTTREYRALRDRM
jgi:hypothetical protein